MSEFWTAYTATCSGLGGCGRTFRIAADQLLAVRELMEEHDRLDTALRLGIRADEYGDYTVYDLDRMAAAWGFDTCLSCATGEDWSAEYDVPEVHTDVAPDETPCVDEHSRALLARCDRCRLYFCLACGQGDDECVDGEAATHITPPCAVCGDPYDPAHNSTLALDHRYQPGVRP